MTFVRLPADHPLADLAAELRRRLEPTPGREVVLDEGTHTYTAGGEPRPSVSSIRRGPGSDAADYDFADQDAVRRGRDVHAAIAEIEIKRHLFRPQVRADLASYVDAWDAFVETVGWVSLVVEQPLEGVLWLPCPRCGAATCVHREPEGFRYCGTPDVIGVMVRPPAWWSGGWLTVLDWKSGSTMPGHVGQQVAAYVLAVRAAIGDLRSVVGAGLRVAGDGSQLRVVGEDDGQHAGPFRLERKRTKADGEDYEGHRRVPLKTTFRHVGWGDFEEFTLSALTYHGAMDRGGDAEEDTGLQPGRLDLHLWSPAGPLASREVPA